MSPLSFPFNIIERLRFWTLLTTLAAYVISYYVPTFPFGPDVLLQVVLVVLALFGVTVELRVRKLARTLMLLGILPPQ